MAMQDESRDELPEPTEEEMSPPRTPEAEAEAEAGSDANGAPAGAASAQEGDPLGSGFTDEAGAGLRDEEKTMGMLCHLAALAGLLGLPFGNVIGPLIIWLIKKDESAYVDAQGKASLNFQITASIIGAIGAVITFVLFFFFIGILLVPVLVLYGVAVIVLAVIAGLKANEGEFYDYPFSIQFIK